MVINKNLFITPLPPLWCIILSLSDHNNEGGKGHLWQTKRITLQLHDTSWWCCYLNVGLFEKPLGGGGRVAGTPRKTLIVFAGITSTAPKTESFA